MKRNASYFVIYLLYLLSPVVAGAVTLDVNSTGQITGAQQVDVNGTMYDVAFVDGSCVGLFNGCDGIADFTFSTRDQAVSAASALLTTVFVDGESGNFDTDPTLTAGCTDTPCIVATPYRFDQNYQIVGYSEAANYGVNGYDAINGFSGAYIDDDFSTSTTTTYAIWSLSMPAVPLPPALPLFLSGLIGLLLRRRRVS